MTTINKAKLEDYQNIVGIQLKGELVEKKYESINGLKSVTHFVVSQESLDYLKSQVKPDNVARILTSYGVYTRDFRFDRVNFHVNDLGVVSKISIG